MEGDYSFTPLPADDSWTTTEWIIVIIMLIVSITISVIDILMDVGDAAIDAVSAGSVGAITNIADLILEIILELIQIILISITIWYAWGFGWKTGIGITLVVICGITDIILSLLGFLPYFDIVESIGEIIIEIIQNIVLIAAMF